jgi:hypothetical protein
LGFGTAKAVIASRAVTVQNFVEIEAVNAAEGIELIERRYCTLVLDVRKPADQDGEIRVSPAVRNLLTGGFHIAKAKVEAFTGAAEATSSLFRAMILSLDVGDGRRGHVEYLQAGLYPQIVLRTIILSQFVLKTEQGGISMSCAL